jgi:hypothetical protein
MATDFSSIEGHKIHLQEPKDAIAITDGIEVFSVPRKYVAAILKAVPEVRYSFEHLGGQHQKPNFTNVPWNDTR